MQDIELLKERSRLYKPLYNSLKKKNIKYNEYLILGEIFINLKDQLKIKNLVSRYILDSIKSFHDKKIKYSPSIIKKYEPEILALPNITPNGVIVPKKENIRSYFKLQSFIFKLSSKYCLNKIADKTELCEVRLMRSNKHNYNSNRSYASSKIHSDTWSGNPCDSKVALFIDGDKNNTINFFKPKKVDRLFFKKKKNYDQAIRKYGFRKLKKFNYRCLTIFDQTCLHKTMNKNKGLRLSLDFGITLKFVKNKKTFLKRYKKRFVKKKINYGEIKKLISLKSIHEKY